jgi:hypothetical protein
MSPQRHRHHSFQQCFDIPQGIEGLNQRLVRAVGSPVAPCGFLLFDLCGVGKHYAEEIEGGAAAPDRPFEPFCNEPGQKSAMVEMRVRQKHCV